MTQKSEQQLQLFDPDEYLDMDGNWNITIDFDDKEFADIKMAAKFAGMELNEYINYALKQTLLKEGMK